MRLTLLALLWCAASVAAVLPDGMGQWKKESATAAAPADEKVWQEYGFQDGETTNFADGEKKLAITAWRFGDATGAMAAFDMVAPADAKPSTLSKRSVQTASGAVVAVGNYLFRFDGIQPSPAELNYLVGAVPKYAASPLPTLPGFLPTAGRVSASERYILGPDSLAKFAPEIPPSTAGFHFGAEGDLVKYGTPGKESTLVVFTYPTMDIARERLGQFQGIRGAMVKRSGPMVAAVLHAPNPDAAERLLAQVKYQAEITFTEHVPTLKDNPGNLFLNIAILVGILVGFCVLSGLAVGGLKYLFRRGGSDGEGSR